MPHFILMKKIWYKLDNYVLFKYHSISVYYWKLFWRYINTHVFLGISSALGTRSYWILDKHYKKINNFSTSTFVLKLGNEKGVRSINFFIDYVKTNMNNDGRNVEIVYFCWYSDFPLVISSTRSTHKRIIIILY